MTAVFFPGAWAKTVLQILIQDRFPQEHIISTEYYIHTVALLNMLLLIVIMLVHLLLRKNQ